MTRVAQAWKRVLVIKGLGTRRPSLLEAARTGEEWIRRMMSAHRLTDADLDALVEINNEVGLGSAERLLALRAKGDLDETTLLLAMHASGFSNGLALGLELGRE